MSNTVLKPRLIRVRYFIWLMVPLSIYAVSQTQGTPHMRWSYRYVDNGASMTNRYYTHCTYVGFSGVSQFHPMNGDCPFVQLFKKEE